MTNYWGHCKHMKKSIRRNTILWNNFSRCKSIRKRRKKALAMSEVNMEEVVAKDKVEVVDMDEEATTIMKKKENTQHMVVGGATQGQGMTSHKSSVIIVKNLVTMLQNVELPRPKLKKRLIM